MIVQAGMILLEQGEVPHPHILADGVGGDVHFLAHMIGPVGVVGLGHHGHILVARRLAQACETDAHHKEQSGNDSSHSCVTLGFRGKKLAIFYHFSGRLLGCLEFSD